MFYFFCNTFKYVKSPCFGKIVSSDSTSISKKSLIHLIVLIWHSLEDGHHDKCIVFLSLYVILLFALLILKQIYEALSSNAEKWGKRRGQFGQNSRVLSFKVELLEA